MLIIQYLTYPGAECREFLENFESKGFCYEKSLIKTL